VSVAIEWEKTNGLPVRRIGRTVLTTEDLLIEWVRKREVKKKK
jgi:hypothetical protein